jgi:protein-tyrosine phosphatase
MGNSCRSPAAECVFRSLVERDGRQHEIECDSAGTIDYHTGARPDARMRQAGQERGVHIAGSARQIQASDLEEFDLIVTMDGDNLRYVRELDRDGDGCQGILEHAIEQIG